MIDLLTYLMMWLKMLIEIMLTSTYWSVMTKEIQNNTLYKKNLWIIFIHLCCLT